MIKKKIEFSQLIELFSCYFLRPPQINLINSSEAKIENMKLFEDIAGIIINDNRDDFTYENNIEDYENENFTGDLILEVQPYYHESTIKTELIKIFMNEDQGNYLVRKSKSGTNYELIVA
ncbi:hypothetical protein MXB_141 [Myxobolus squamalis]|nr:hypothetical protein MXB_141 [Myxobolus squamalis]